MSVFAHQLRSEQRVFWRTREAAFFIFLFPLLLFLLLGSIYTGTIYGVPAPRALLAGMIGYGCANTAFAGLAIQLVVRRESGILKRLRATPLPAPAYVAAMLASTVIVFAIQTASLFVLGRILYGTPFPGGDTPSLVVAIVYGAIVFAALGVATAAFIRSAEGSSAIVNFILLPMAFLSGAFGPTKGYPEFLRAIGDVLPLTYLVKLVNAVYLHGDAVWTQPEALAILVAWGAAGLVFTRLKFGWEPRER